MGWLAEELPEVNDSWLNLRQAQRNVLRLFRNPSTRFWPRSIPTLKIIKSSAVPIATSWRESKSRRTRNDRRIAAEAPALLDLLHTFTITSTHFT